MKPCSGIHARSHTHSSLLPDSTCVCIPTRRRLHACICTTPHSTISWPCYLHSMTPASCASVSPQRFLETKKRSRAAQRRHTVPRAATRRVCCCAGKRPCGFTRLQAICSRQPANSADCQRHWELIWTDWSGHRISPDDDS
jgi:hypothetical protein